MSGVVLALLAALAQAPIAPSNGSGGPDQSATPARITGLHVRGNHTTPDSDVIRIAGVAIGDPVLDSTLEDVRQRLERSGRFRHVEVLRRYDSLDDLSSILLVIVVEERAGITLAEPEPGPLRRLRANTMWLPMLRYEDGYGFTYGARVSFVDLLGPRARVSTPVTWGGERTATVEVERTFSRGPLSRVLGTAGVSRREHPALGIGDRRSGGTVLAERAVTPWLRLGASAGMTDVHFGSTTDTLASTGLAATIDTRRDPEFPRNAVFASLGWERLSFSHAPDTSRVTTDLRGYVGLMRSMVLALRLQNVRAADPLPVFEQSLLGGGASLRGFPLGFEYGDRMTSTTVELRMPVTSPRHLGRAGVAVFVDKGAAYDAHTALKDATFHTGVGAGWFLQMPVLSFRIDVAHGLDAGTRAHVALGVTF
jgi:outer membrane protein assembly factor BamA